MRAAEAVRDGKASAMVSAGNTGATMASALLRMGRIKGVARPAIATPIPCPGADTPTVLLDAGANAECQPEWLVQFAQMGAVFARERYGIAEPRVGPAVDRRGAAARATPLVKETHELLADGAWAGTAGATFVGNVEGRDIMSPDVDVVVTDGFTGNVALKTLEGGMRALVDAILGAFGTDEATRAAADDADAGAAAPVRQLDPDNTGGAMLLGVNGVCIISHGSSSATADRERRPGGRRAGRTTTSSARSPAPSRSGRPAGFAGGRLVHKRTSGGSATLAAVLHSLPRSSSCPLRPMLSRAP